jgi:hypothetical protein
MLKFLSQTHGPSVLLRALVLLSQILQCSTIGSLRNLAARYVLVHNTGLLKITALASSERNTITLHLFLKPPQQRVKRLIVLGYNNVNAFPPFVPPTRL